MAETFTTEDQKVELSADDIVLVWHLACALVPQHNGNFVAAFADATFQRSRLLSQTREREGGLVISPPTHPEVVLVRSIDGRWALIQELE